jgi:hypothetical protein
MRLIVKFILEPSSAASDMLKGENVFRPGLIFTISCVVNAYLLYIKPIDFPSEFSEAVLSISKKTFLHYLALDLFGGMIFVAIFSGFFVLFAGLIKNGRLAVKLLVFVAFSGIFAGWTLYFKQMQIMSIFGAIAVLSVVVYRSILQKNNFAAFLKFALASNIVVLAAMPFCFLAIPLNSENLYVFSGAVAGLWMFVLLVKAAKVIAGGTALRQTIALFFSFLAALIFVYMLKNTGVINSETLKFILFM